MNRIVTLILNKIALFSKLLVGLFFVAGFLFSAYHLMYANKVIPGVKLAGIDFSGKTQKETQASLESLFSKEPKATFKYQDLQFVVSSTDINLKYSVKDTTQKLFNLGRTGNFYVDTKDKLAGLVKGISVPANYTYDDGLLNQKISEIESKVEVEHLDPVLIINDKDELVVTKAQGGKEITKEKVKSQIIQTLEGFADKNFSLPVNEVTPDNSEKDVEAVKPAVEKIIANSPVIKFEGREWKFSKQDLLALLAYEKNGSSVLPVLNKDNLNTLIDQIASEIDVPATGEVLKTDGNRVVEFKPKTDGKTVNKGELIKDFTKALFNDQKDVSIVVVESKAPDGDNKYGIYALLGEGVSYFAGSIPGRVKNLSLASERASNVLVPSGETYSFNKNVGEITGATGYDQAYIIQNGRTVLGEGGGVCQASTTLFRAALNAGLPITKRAAHAYRVGYYEQQSEPGLDATVFSPSVDFEFKNDTPGYILIQHELNLSKNELIFRIYGTPDGRVVKIEKPVILSQTPPPEPSYQDDGNYRKGQIIQVEHATWGAVVSAKRLVTKGDTVMYDDTFISRYQPWRAVYLRGTK